LGTGLENKKAAHKMGKEASKNAQMEEKEVSKGAETRGNVGDH